MQPSKGSSTSFVKRLLFRESLKHPLLQHLWSRLHTITIFGMNYGGGGLIESSGEIWVLSQIVSKACKDIDSPIVFDVGANIGDYSLCLRDHLPAARIYAFEPADSVYQELVRRINASGADRQIKPHKLGFSESEKLVELYSYTVEGQNASVLSSLDQRLPTQALDVRTDRSELVQVQTLDGFCEAEEIDHIDFLKLDR